MKNGVTATVEALSALIASGNPLLRMVHYGHLIALFVLKNLKVVFHFNSKHPLNQQEINLKPLKLWLREFKKMSVRRCFWVLLAQEKPIQWPKSLKKHSVQL